LAFVSSPQSLRMLPCIMAGILSFSRSGKLERPPVFIIGCGRSGTTIFGTTLSKHSKITYLNERRDIWTAAYPETDIWTQDRKTHGRMHLTAADERGQKTRILCSLFQREIQKSKRPVLVEKLPINTFRLRFIHAAFPEACFIHLYRNGLEVARSIEERCRQGRWYSLNSFKWSQLEQFAMSKPECAGLPALCTGAYEKGLLEWRLGTAETIEFLSGLPENRFLEVSYGDFVCRPSEIVTRVLTFLDLENEPEIQSFVESNIHRKSQPLDSTPISPTELAIGGQLLQLSVADPKGVGLTKRFQQVKSSLPLA
jgi:hypothetical protein